MLFATPPNVSRLSLVLLGLGTSSASVYASSISAPPAGFYTNQPINDPLAQYSLRPTNSSGDNNPVTFMVDSNTQFLYNDAAATFAGQPIDSVLTDPNGFHFINVNLRSMVDAPNKLNPDMVTIGDNFSYIWNIDLSGSQLSTANGGKFYALGGNGVTGFGPFATVTIGDSLHIQNQDGLRFEYSVVDLTIGQNARLETQAQALLVGQAIGAPKAPSTVNIGSNLYLSGGSTVGTVLAQYGVEMNFSSNSTFEFYESDAWNGYTFASGESLVGFRTNGGNTTIDLRDSTINTTVKNADFIGFSLNNGAFGYVAGTNTHALVYGTDYNNVSNEIIVANSVIHVVKDPIGIGQYTLAQLDSLSYESSGVMQDTYLRLENVQVDAASIGGRAFNIQFYNQDFSDTSNHILVDIIQSDLSDLTGGIIAQNPQTAEDGFVSRATFFVQGSHLTGGASNQSTDELVFNLDQMAKMEGGLRNENNGDIYAYVHGNSTLTGNLINQGLGNIYVDLDRSQYTGDVYQYGQGNVFVEAHQQSVLNMGVTNQGSGATVVQVEQSQWTGNADNQGSGSLYINLSQQANMLGNIQASGTGTTTIGLSQAQVQGDIKNTGLGNLQLTAFNQSVIQGNLLNTSQGSMEAYLDQSQLIGTIQGLGAGRVDLELLNQSVWNVTGDSQLHSIHVVDSAIEFTSPSTGRPVGNIVTVKNWNADQAHVTLYANQEARDRILIDGQELTQDIHTLITVIDGGGFRPDTPQDPEVKFVYDDTLITGPYTTPSYVDPLTGSIYLDTPNRYITPEYRMYQSMSETLVRGSRSLAVSSLGDFNSLLSPMHDTGTQSSHIESSDMKPQRFFADIRTSGGNKSAGSTSAASDYRQTQLVVGGDLFGDSVEKKSFAFGILGNYQRVDDDLSTPHGQAIGTNTVTSYGLGAYGRLETEADMFASVAVMHYWSTVDSAALNPRIAKHSVDAKALALSGEIGQFIQIHPDWRLAPSVQAIYQRTSFDPFSMEYGKNEIASVNSYYTRVGIKSEYNLGNGFQFNSTAHAWHQLGGRSEIRAYGLSNGAHLGTIRESGSNTWGQLKVGVARTVDHINWFADGGYQGTFDGKEDSWTVKLGVQARF